MDINDLLVNAIHASVKAGEAIMKVYQTPFDVEKKEDNSPLTMADKNAHDIIIKHLSNTELPILSEEGKNVPYSERKNWKYFWMIDPLDGTKEFIKHNGEFTVNIALINNQQSILGVIYVPASKTLYFGNRTLGAFKYILNSLEGININILMSSSEKLPSKNNRPYTIVASRSHLSEETALFIEELKKEHQEVRFISSGSSIKLCLVADGSADIYPRFAPTMEWDTAAGQAIAEAAGKKVIDYATKEPLLYNKENLLNNWFVVK